VQQRRVVVEGVGMSTRVAVDEPAEREQQQQERDEEEGEEQRVEVGVEQMHHVRLLPDLSHRHQSSETSSIHIRMPVSFIRSTTLSHQHQFSETAASHPLASSVSSSSAALFLFALSLCLARHTLLFSLY
jgi:hypothetical protein